MNYQEAIAFLDTHINMETGAVHDATDRTPDTSVRGVNAPDVLSGRSFSPPSLDRMRRLCAFLGDPQLDLDILHITGTNGKGSTARMALSLLHAHGLSVGLYTSPHLHRPNERIASHDGDITDIELAEIVRVLAIAENAAGQRNSWFELVTAGAYRWFSDLAVEAAVVEVGAGGRWDATNVGDGAVSVITNIDLDHQQWFGNTKLDIAREKIGIVKSGSIALIGEPDPDIQEYLVTAARQSDAAAVLTTGVDFACDSNRIAMGGRVCTLRTPRKSYANIFVPLHGAHQGENAAVALAAVEAFVDAPLEQRVVEAGFASVTHHGRMEVASRDPLVILDGAHNPAGARIASATLDDEFAANDDRILVVGLLHPRDPGEMLESLGAKRASMVIAVPAPTPRSLDPMHIADAARALGVPCRVAASVEGGIDEAMTLAGENSVVLVSGTLYLVAAARAFLRS